jgi:hypothetical protein
MQCGLPEIRPKLGGVKLVDVLCGAVRSIGLTTHLPSPKLRLRGPAWNA